MTQCCALLPQMERFQELGVWRADAWQPELGVAGLKARRNACGGSLAKCSGRRQTGWRWLAAFSLLGVAAMLLVAARWVAKHGHGSLLPRVTRGNN